MMAKQWEMNLCFMFLYLFSLVLGRENSFTLFYFPQMQNKHKMPSVQTHKMPSGQNRDIIRGWVTSALPVLRTKTHLSCGEGPGVVSDSPWHTSIEEFLQPEPLLRLEINLIFITCNELIIFSWFIKLSSHYKHYWFLGSLSWRMTKYHFRKMLAFLKWKASSEDKMLYLKMWPRGERYHHMIAACESSFILATSIGQPYFSRRDSEQASPRCATLACELLWVEGNWDSYSWETFISSLKNLNQRPCL